MTYFEGGVRARAETRIDRASVDTNNRQRDAYGRSSNFLDTDDRQNITRGPTAEVNGSLLALLDRQHSDVAETFTRVKDENLDRSAELARLVTEIASHVAVERTFLYPLAKEGRLGHPHLAKDLLADYRKMHTLLVRIDRRKTNSPDMPDLVTELLHTVETHQARCATIYALVLEHFEQDELDDLALRMNRAEQVIHSHPHPVLLRLGGPIYKRTTKLASRWDRLRDRTVRNR